MIKYTYVINTVAHYAAAAQSSRTAAHILSVIASSRTHRARHVRARVQLSWRGMCARPRFVGPVLLFAPQ